MSYRLLAHPEYGLFVLDGGDALSVKDSTFSLIRADHIPPHCTEIASGNGVFRLKMSHREYEATTPKYWRLHIEGSTVYAQTGTIGGGDLKVSGNLGGQTGETAEQRLRAYLADYDEHEA